MIGLHRVSGERKAIRVKHDLAWMAQRSLVNCHCLGLDSIVIDERQGKLTRIFMTSTHHRMWRNRLPLTREMSVALHPHHCDLTITPLLGTVYNVVVAADGKWYDLSEFRYESPITNGKGNGRFIPTGEYKAFPLRQESINAPLTMRAFRLHTIYVPEGEVAAWLIEEGTEDLAYQPYCYSNTDLSHLSMSELYGPMLEHYIHSKLNYLKEKKCIEYSLSLLSR